MSKQAAEKQTKIHIFVNRRKIDLSSEVLTGAGLLQAAGFSGQDWELFELKGEGDPSGGELIRSDQEVHLKNGDRFRVIPGNRTFGA